MRTIKFRGKRYGDGDWVYGNLYRGTTDGKQYSIILNDAGYHVAPQDDRNLAIAFSENEVNVVFTQTVGQFTGLLDKNGKEIYEGDIIEIKEVGGYGCKRKGIVEYDVEECAFIVRVLPPSWAGIARLSTKAQICADGNCTHEYINQYTVIGNIHDNPELLKTETL